MSTSKLVIIAILGCLALRRLSAIRSCPGDVDHDVRSQALTVITRVGWIPLLALLVASTAETIVAVSAGLLVIVIGLWLVLRPLRKPPGG